MKILAWNILAGGAKRADAIVQFVEESACDVAVLTEVRASSEALLGKLKERGWNHQVIGAGAPRCGGVALISRHSITPRTPAPTAASFPGRWVEAEVSDLGCAVVGLYGPLHKEDFDGFWETAIAAFKRRRDEPLIVAGDLNTGESLADAPAKNFFCSAHFAALKELGYVDAWRRVHGDRREYTWYSPKKGGGSLNGFRLDHVLLSPAVESRLVDAHYVHGPRDSRVSDHSPLIVQLGPSSAAAPVA